MEKEQILEFLLKDTVKNMEQAVQEKLEAVETSFGAQLDGVRTRLNGRISEITSVIEQKPLCVNFGTVEEPKNELVHSAFNTIINILKSTKRNPKNIMMVGEAGSGKTHLASSVAKALGLKFYPMSVGLQTTKSDLLGFINAHGQYVTSPIREAFEHGEVLLLDEFDSTHAGVVTIINSLLANGHCSFPDRIVDKHEKFVCMVACNTYGHGANIDYVGRNRLDGATLDRFVVVNVGYDRMLETQLTSNEMWYSVIDQIRKNIEKQGIKMIVSPRASMNGADLLDAGFKIEQVIDMVVMKGADEDTRIKLMKGIDLSNPEQIIKPPKKFDYTRDLEKYQTYVIRTQDDSFDELISVQTLNKIIDSNYQKTFQIQDKEYCIHCGSGWNHQYSGRMSIYFGSSSMCELTDRYKPVLKEFFEDLDEKDLHKSWDKPIAFEFIVKGCKKPWNVIRIEREDA